MIDYVPRDLVCVSYHSITMFKGGNEA